MLGRPIHLAISVIEHEAVQMAAVRLEQGGHQVTRLPVDHSGVVDLPAMQNLCASQPPNLVSVMAVNNETGVIQPVANIAQVAKQHGALMHCDAVRAVGHGFEELLSNPDIDLLNCTAHKFGGPRGVGVLIQRGIKLPQLICGGGQEGGSRAGTENLAGIAGLVAALTDATAQEAAGIEQLREEFEAELLLRFPTAQIHGKLAPRGTHITSVGFPGLSAKKLQAKLDDQGLCVGTGSACHDDGQESLSPVLCAMHTPLDLIRGTLRISLGWNSSRQDWVTLLDILEELVHGPLAAELSPT
jgi:cysteine desulfurase